MIFRIVFGVLALCAISFGAFIVAVEHPSTRGPVRCWLQESLYTQSWEEAPEGTPIIEAVRVTEPVRDLCDAADDPAIWVTENGFRVLGTNKQRSVNLYDESGAVLSRADALGAPNNVDLRVVDGAMLALASDKDEVEIEVFIGDPTAKYLLDLPSAPLPARAEEELYGICLYQSAEQLFAFTTDKSGLIVQYLIEIAPEDGNATAREVRSLRVATQPEGCVVDDKAGALFVGEEDAGIWRFDASADGAAQGTLIARTRPEGELVADVEGLAIYRGDTEQEGYLVASSQGDNTYAVFDRAAPHSFRGRFQVRFDGDIIGDTDGLEVTSAPLGDDFPRGLLVVQDGFVRTGGRLGMQELTGERRFQRFAYISWADVEAALNLSD